MEAINGTSGHKVEKFPITVESHEDFIRLREAWRHLPMVPKIVRPGGVPEVNVPGQFSADVLLCGEETAGTVAVFILHLEPGFTAPEHHQPNEEEFFFVLEGQLELKIGDETTVASPGTFGFAPRNVTHAFKNVGAATCRILTWNAPAGHERVFEAGERLARANKTDKASRFKMLDDHETIFHDRSAADDKPDPFKMRNVR